MLATEAVLVLSFNSCPTICYGREMVEKAAYKRLGLRNVFKGMPYTKERLSPL